MPVALLLALVPTLQSSDEAPLDRLRVWADGRVRAEATFDQPGGDDRYRGRMRMRVSARYDLTPSLAAETRLSTTSGDPNNPHWDFGDGDENFEGSEVRLDRFYLDWQPCEDLAIQTGQFAHAFRDPPIFDEVVWDDDVQPAGVAVRYGSEPEEGLGFDVRAVAYMAVENGASTDANMLGVQLNMYHQDPGVASFRVGTSVMDWSNTGAGIDVFDNQGNTDLAGEFLVWEGHAAGSVERGPLGRTTAYCQFMHNSQDTTGEDDGYSVGLMFGRRREEGALNVFGNYYDLDANSIFSPPAQDATPIGGTGIGFGMHGIFAGIEYWVTDTLSLELTVLTSDAEDSDDPVRWRFDVDFAVP